MSQQQLTLHILILGESGVSVGKTTLVEQYVYHRFNPKLTSTIGVDFLRTDILIDNYTVIVQVWDGPCQIQPKCYNNKDGFIIAYSNQDKEVIKTLENFKSLICENTHREDFHNLPIYVIQNDFDQKSDIETDSLVKSWCKQNGVSLFFKVFAKENQGVEDAFKRICQNIFSYKYNITNKNQQQEEEVNNEEYFPKTSCYLTNFQTEEKVKCSMIEKIDSIKCCYEHNSPPIIVLLDDNLIGQQRLICSQCIIDIKGRFNGIRVDEAIQIIEDKKNDFLNLITNMSNKNIESLTQFIEEIKENKSLILQILDQMINQINLWMDEIFQVQQRFGSYSFYEEIDLLNHSFQNSKNNELEQFKITMKGINESYESKILITKQQLYERLQISQKILKLNPIENFLTECCPQKNLIEKESKLNNVEIEQLSYKLIQQMQQKEWCHSLAFNFNGSIMAAGLGKKIKIWNFENGQFMDNNIILDGHEKLIKNIVFSNKQNWFFSGSEDHTIRSWKEKQSRGWFSSKRCEWESVKANKSHQNWVIQLILNEKETELISCSIDKTIKIWEISYDSNSIKFLQSLEKHQKQIQSISLNQSQTQLISCCENKQIILWQKSENLQWQFKQFILFSNQVNFINAKFINNDQILCQTSLGQVQIYNLEDDCNKKQYELTLDIRQQSKESQIIFNNLTQLIILKIHRNCYFLKILKTSSDKLQIASKPLDCQKEESCCNITNDGKYFIVWIWYPILQFKVYELQQNIQ